MTPTSVDGLLALGGGLGAIALRWAHPSKATLGSWQALGDALVAMFATVVVWRLGLVTGALSAEAQREVAGTWVAVVAFGGAFGGFCVALVQLLTVRLRRRAVTLVSRWLPDDATPPAPMRRWDDLP